MDNIKTTIIVDVDTNLKTGVSVINLLFPKEYINTESFIDASPSPLMKVKK